MKRRLLKSVLYRIFAIVLVQFVIWIIFHNTDFNIVLGLTELVRMIGYYTYDWIFDTLWQEHEIKCFCGKIVVPNQIDPATIINYCTGDCSNFFCKEHEYLLKFKNNYLQCANCREMNKDNVRFPNDTVNTLIAIKLLFDK